MAPGREWKSALSNGYPGILRSPLPLMVLGVLIASSCLVVWSPGAGGQAPTIDYSVRMERDEVWIDTRPEQNNSVTNALRIKNTSIHFLSISINAACTNGLAIDPQEIAVEVIPQPEGNYSAQYRIEYTISLTTDTKTNDSADCTITLIVYRVDGVSSPDSSPRSTGFKVHFAPDPQVVIECPQFFTKLAPGMTMGIYCKVRNHGGLTDSYIVVISNAKELESKGWTIEYGSPVVANVQPGDYERFYATLTAPDDKLCCWMELYPVIEMRAESLGWEDSNVTDECSASFWVRGVSYSNWLLVILTEGIILVVLASINRNLKARARWKQTQARFARIRKHKKN